MRLAWAEASSPFTALFEAPAISWLKEASQQDAADLLALSWDEIHGILERSVQHGLAHRSAEPIAHLGVDEKSFRKRHRYFTIVNDLNRSRELFVAEGRRKASLDGFWETLSEEPPEHLEEGSNSRIQWVKATARGFRTQHNFINAIYFH